MAIAALLNSAAKDTIKDHYKDNLKKILEDQYKDNMEKLRKDDYEAYIKKLCKNSSKEDIKKLIEFHKSDIEELANRLYKSHIEELINHPLCDINQINKEGYTIIHQAVFHRNHVLLEMLLKKEDIDVNALDKDELSPIHRAIMKNDKKVFDILVTKEGIDLNLVCKGFFPIARGISLRRAELLTKLLEKEGLNFNIKTEKGLPLIHYLVRYFDSKVWEVVMQGTKDSNNQIDVNEKDSYGNTALHWALYKKEHFEEVYSGESSYGEESSEKELIKVINNLLDHKDINVNINADRLYTPLHIVIASKNFNEELCLKLLRHKNLKVDNNDQTTINPYAFAWLVRNKAAMKILKEDRRFSIQRPAIDIKWYYWCFRARKLIESPPNSLPTDLKEFGALFQNLNERI